MSELNAADANRVPVGIKDVVDFREVKTGECAKRAHLFFQNNPDHSRIFVLFNGEVPARLLDRGPTFQRWTWAADFAHPVLCVSDVAVDGRDDMQIGWYVESAGGGVFDDLMDEVESVCEDVVGKAAQIVCIGSSAGGFAALMASCKNRCDGAVVFNPQVDIMKYHERALSRFVSRFRPDFADPLGRWESRTSLLPNISEYNGRAGVTYWQNTEDRFHYKNHCERLQKSLLRLPPEVRRNFSFKLYADAQAGHNPPKKEAFLHAIEEAYPGSVATAIEAAN